MGEKKITLPLTSADFVHLHNHSHYSLLDGLQKVPEMLDRVVELGMGSVAITDHGTLSGAIEFYEGAKERHLRPIIGIETYVASRLHTNRDPAKDRGRFHLILLAMNETGYRNLMRLSTIANLEGFYHKPRIDHKLLEKYNEGLICLSGCIGGELGENLRNGQISKAEEIASWYKSVFGDRYYLELQDHAHKWQEQANVNKELVRIGKKLDIPCVVTCDAHYLKHEDQEAHEILLCVQTGAFLSDKDRMSLTETDLFVTDPKDIIERWGATNPEAIRNTRLIAERCNLELNLGNIFIPQFPVPEGKTEKSYLHVLVYQGLAWRYGGVDYKKSQVLSIAEAKQHLPRDILERAEYELNTIDNMGFNGYFLIIWDFINWGKNQGIVFGPGRGSAAGSIVAYSLRITELDPIAYDLLFERFLNPDRISMPDIDIDIQDSRRDEVIQYCVEKYGTDRVANIVTFGRMAARNAVRDVARVLQVPYAEADRLAKMIPPPVQGRHIPLKKSLDQNEDLKSEYDSNPTSKRVFDMAMRLEGTIRSHGVHAAGVVIAPDDIVGFVPLELAQKGVVATQYSMGPIEDIGLLKMDFLGLSNLTIIKNALRIIRKVYKKDINLANLPLDDKKTFELLQKGETTGVFQLESAGMKRYLKELKPTVFEDIIAMVALYRPGPMQWIEDFIARKHGRREIDYLHPAMEPALKTTYGVIVYQEQVMQISKDMCGFTGGQADTLRKAIGKKNAEVLAKQKDAFIDGAIRTVGVERATVEQLWKSLEDFAAYCFNKSHAACYAMIAYQTAYLKAHYPAAFMAALLTSDYDNIDRLAIEISECRHMGIAVLPPDVNESFHEFAVVPKAGDTPERIRFGLDAIKNVGRGAVEEIVNQRDAGGRFNSLVDFVKRVSTSLVNRKAWESLIKAGAFDRFGDRGALLHSLDNILSVGNKLQKDIRVGQTDLFGAGLGADTEATLSIQLLDPPKQPTPQERLAWERELLGLYLSHHPLRDFEAFLEEQTISTTSIATEHDGQEAIVGGFISALREITTKNGQTMAFVKLEDRSGEIELVVFPSVYKKEDPLWQRDQIIMVTGVVNSRDRTGNQTSEVKLLVNSAELVDRDKAADYKPTGQKTKFKSAPKRQRSGAKLAQTTGTDITPNKVNDERLFVRLRDSSNQQQLVALKNHLDINPGTTQVLLVLGPDNRKQVIKLPYSVRADESLVGTLGGIVGSDNVKLQ